MVPSTMTTVVLVCHPETHGETVHRIEAGVCWHDGALAFNYTLEGDITRLRIPLPRLPRRTDRLWQHTCFEAFVSVKDKPEYYEFNFAPSGEWAVYRFRCYRDPSTRPPTSTGEHSLGIPLKSRGVVLSERSESKSKGSDGPALPGELHGAPLEDEELDPRITVRSVADRLNLDAIVRLDRLPTIEPHASLRLALSAVVEEERGVLSYWALKHPPGKPDFHHPDAFMLELEPLDVDSVKESAIDKR
jgi:hypothetical protein